MERSELCGNPGNNLQYSIELNIQNPITNLSEPRLIDEYIIFNPELSGLDYFIDVYSGGANGLYGEICDADRVRDGSILEWMFGWSPGAGLPSVSGMLHFGGQYTAGCPQVVRGVEVNTFRGKWNISAWDALLDVKYYWSSESPDSFQTFLICVTRP